MVDVAPLIADLRAEGAALDDLVSALTPEDWSRATPSEGWTIAHQISHLGWTDRTSVVALTDPERFTGPFMQELMTYLERGVDPVDATAAEGAERDPADLLSQWRTDREALADAFLANADRSERVPWFGPPMSVASMITARLMETWAHGQDVADALGVRRTPSARLAQIAHLGVRTRDFAYAARGRPAPTSPFRVELVAPDGSTWAYGPEDANDRVSGSAEDFCLLVTQRRHRDDLDLVAVGDDADAWLDIAQAFAGNPGNGRAPGQFA